MGTSVQNLLQLDLHIDGVLLTTKLWYWASKGLCLLILALHSLLRIEEKLFPNHLVSVLYPQVCQEPHLLQGCLQPRQRRSLVAREHMASLAKEMYRMGLAPLFKCRGMYSGQPKLV